MRARAEADVFPSFVPAQRYSSYSIFHYTRVPREREREAGACMHARPLCESEN